MSSQFEQEILCPYCGEPLTILVDGSVETQNYIEDCQVCCWPIELSVLCLPDQAPQVSARHEDEV
jgi:hypothetical protein